MIFDLNTVFLLTSGFAALSLPVTSSLIHPNARDLGTRSGGICLHSRFYSTPCFFGDVRGLGRSLRFTHAQTNLVNSTAKGLVSKQVDPWLLSDCLKWVT